MKKNQNAFILVLICSVFSAACSSSAPQPATSNANTAAVVTKTDGNSPLIASSHGAKNAQNSSVSSSNNGGAPRAPMMTGNATAIDTTEFDAEISKAEKDYKAKAKDETAKKTLAEAYAKRAFALTEAAQYRAALGDFRKSLKLDPTNQTAQSMHDEIVRIFQQMGRDVPAEGAEPTPLPFKKRA